MTSRRPRITPDVARAGVLVALLVALGVAALLVELPPLAAVRAWVDGLGAAGPPLFVACYACAVLAPVPKSVLSTAAGLAFGIVGGAAVVLAGATTGALAAFSIARATGRPAVSRLVGDRLGRVDAMIERHGVLAALAVRLVPVIPFTVLNYACGVTAMRGRHFVPGTAVGLLPSTLLLVTLGSLGAEVSPWVPVLGSVASLSVTAVAAVVWRARRAPAAPPPRTA